MHLSGLHHVTAICGDAQKNIDFYAGLLGFRLVKVTINFDDPGTYHLYYGDRTGSPGSVLTFFAWPSLPRGKAGSSQASLLTLSVPRGSIEWWRKRIGQTGQEVTSNSSEKSIRFEDQDGIQLEMIETDRGAATWTTNSIPSDRAVTGFESVTLSVGRLSASQSLLDSMGFQSTTSDANDLKLTVLDQTQGQRIKLNPTAERGAPGVGTIHHVAFAVADEEAQKVASEELEGLGFHPTPVQERQYFRSIYYRESSGVLFEIATEGPGFLFDESEETLGGRLCLPPWYEKYRAQIEEGLPKIKTPSGVLIPS